MARRIHSNLTKSDVLVVLAIAVTAILVWQFAQVLLLLFAAIIVAVLLHSATSVLERHSPLDRRLSLLLVLVVAAAAILGFGYLFGTRVQAELTGLVRRLPELTQAAGTKLNITNPIPKLQDYLSDLVASDGMLGNLAGYTSNAVSILGSVLLIIVGGIYLAADPALYRRGLIMLFPPKVQATAEKAVMASGEALKRWLLGQLIAMVVVGAATTAGLYAIGLESALALGIIAGLLEFVPFFGPVLSAIPAVLIALASGDQTVFWVLGLYLLVQQVENNVLIPIIQRRTADLPPALGIFAVIALGIAFGPLGLLFGTPLTVVLLVLVKYLYVRNTLKEDASIPGIDGDGADSSTDAGK